MKNKNNLKLEFFELALKYILVLGILFGALSGKIDGKEAFILWVLEKMEVIEDSES